ncbi:MAG: ABC transporter ATP-binding protein [Coriobacteriales bacterium]|nr:ABC transporter ATP-binding protein [Coriobacteriales bacterium]
MIEFQDVSAAYEVETPAVRHASLSIADGEFVAFVGSNGAGKSTMMRLANNLLAPTSGRVLIDGVPTSELKASQLARHVGFLFQNPDRQICCDTIREELEFGFRVQGRLDARTAELVNQTISRFGFDPDAEPYLLNRGTRQLLALASVIVGEPTTLILDEPTTGLDYLECCEVMDVVADLNQRGTTVLMVCHDMELIADYAKRLIVMTAGQIIADGPTFDILRDADVCARGDLEPPQVVAISQRLAAENPELAGTPLAQANTLDQMLAAIDSVRNSEKGELR